MRSSFSLAALWSGCLLGTSYAALAEVSGVTVNANAWDTRNTASGCPPDGCVADNVLDDNIEPESRWSCKASVSQIEACELTFVFDEPQDIVEIRIAMFKGNERSRTVNIWADGVLSTTVTTSATTLELEAYELAAMQATTIVLQDAGADNNEWFSVTEVQLMTDFELEAGPPSPAPSSEDYVGCYSDMVGDRLLATVTTNDALTPAECAVTCGEMSKDFYGLQQGNECWCAGCDIDTDFDRHGDGVCSTPCAGDSTSTCGGDLAISLFQISTSTCETTGGSGTEYEVNPDGNPLSLTEALDVAGPGDTISLGDGLYREPIVTMNAGTQSTPLVIKGSRNAVISAFSGNRTLMWDQKVVDIRHSWITLEGFTIDGHLNGLDAEEDFVDKCIFVEGQDAPTELPIDGTTVLSSLIGFRVSDMYIHNCGMECIRMRNFVTNAVISDNLIEDCGIYDYQYQFDGKIGEAVYIGTSSNQWGDGVGTRITNGPDESNYNLVTNNEITSRGNECVDVKEGASFNVIQYNECQEQLDDESGCYDSRGNENTFRFNSGKNCLGAGIRLGGHVIDGFTYGVDNHVYGNDFENNGFGSIKAMQHPQGIICGNTCSGDCEVREQGEDDEIEASWMEECPDDIPGVPFIDP